MFYLFTSLVGLAAATSAQYDIALKLKANGREIAAPRVVVRDGERAKITQKDADGTTFWEIVANERSSGGVKLSFTLGKVDRFGHQSVLSKPQILALENEPAEMTVAEDGAEVLTLSVLAKRKAL